MALVITIGGVVVIEPTKRRVRRAGITVQDTLNEAPNAARLQINGTEPEPSLDQAVTITDNGLLIFAGTTQIVELDFEGRTSQWVRSLSLTDHTATLNKRRPFAEFVETSITDIAKQLIADFAPGFTAVQVQAGLPPTTIIFDGQKDFAGCLTELAHRARGYWQMGYDKDLKLFTVST